MDFRRDALRDSIKKVFVSAQELSVFVHFKNILAVDPCWTRLSQMAQRLNLSMANENERKLFGCKLIILFSQNCFTRTYVSHLF